jgi:hypothetical protein
LGMTAVTFLRTPVDAVGTAPVWPLRSLGTEPVALGTGPVLPLRGLACVPVAGRRTPVGAGSGLFSTAFIRVDVILF